MFELALKLLQNQSDSSAATITNINVRFSAVCLSGPMMVTEKFAFALLPSTLINIDCRVVLLQMGFLKSLLIFHAYLRLASIYAGLKYSYECSLRVQSYRNRI